MLTDTGLRGELAFCAGSVSLVRLWVEEMVDVSFVLFRLFQSREGNFHREGSSCK